jgi:hypothetical protein
MADMMELLETKPDAQVQEAEYKRLLGFPDHRTLQGRARELAEQSRAWYAEHGRPWIYARETADFDLSGGTLRIQEREFASKRLHEQLQAAGAHKGMLVLVSAGRECEQKAQELWLEEKPDEYFFLEIYGSAVAEHLVTQAGARLCGWAEQNGMAVLPHYSPGYTGWDVSDQHRLFELIRPTNGQRFPEDIQVRESGMLQPKKSLLALFGLTRHVERVRSVRDLIPCENCSFSPCQYRRAPFKESLPQLEDVRRLQPGAAAPTPRPQPTGSGLNRAAKYTVNARALRKWSQERLEWKRLEDGAVAARFRYEGTTCSNLGRALVFEYRVRLGPPQGGYKILEADCAPAAGDTGHKEMCAYLEDAEQLLGRIAEEKPLLGRPLDAVLGWERGHSPAGCYCDADSRSHKWGLVLEVLHYALVEDERKMELI